MKRRWFQIHLSTAVVVMIIAGLLLRANLKPNAHSHFYYGFPKAAFSPYILDGEVSEVYPDAELVEDGFGPMPLDICVFGLTVIVWPALIDLVFALAVIAGVTICCEMGAGRFSEDLSRRREAREP